jgi:hypothetical protein
MAEKNSASSSQNANRVPELCFSENAVLSEDFLGFTSIKGSN